MKLALVRVPLQDKHTLWNMLQKYLYEFSRFYYTEMDEQGNYPYRYFDSYFGAPEPGRAAYFIKSGQKTIGFALINRHSETAEEIDYAIAEFCVFPIYRRKHYAREAVKQLFEQFPGKWQMKYHINNLPAAQLWKSAASQYHPVVEKITEAEEALTFLITE